MNKKLLSIFGVSLLVCTLTACNDVSVTTSQDIDSVSSETTSVEPSTSEVVEYTATNPEIFTELAETPREVVAPLTILNSDGENYMVNNAIATYDNIFEAIREAGQASNTRNKLQVQDSNHLQIFSYQKASNYFVFESLKYVGTSSNSACSSYIDAHPNSFGISGTGSEYKQLGRKDMPGSSTINEEVLENNAGAYNYMFSDTGITTDGITNGYSYGTCNVRLSEAVYKRSADGSAWNAYIFFNMKALIWSDLGLIGSYNAGNDRVEWKLVRNCSSEQHSLPTSSEEKEASFYVYHDTLATTMDDYNPETREYTGADDLRFEAIGYSDGFSLNVTNLRTNVVTSFTDRHTNNDGSQLAENGGDKSIYFRTLLAASYCPVVSNVWDTRCGAALKNVVFDHVELAKYVDDNIETYRDSSTKKYEFYPETEAFDQGYAQGADCADFEYGTRETSGTYKSGLSYESGDKYIAFSSYYDK